MTLWYISESQDADESVQRTAGTKAREDLETILLSMGFEPLEVRFGDDRTTMGPLVSAVAHVRVAAAWRRALSVACPGDIVLVQLPAVNHTIGLAAILARCKFRGVRIVSLLHDLESVRAALKPGKSRLAARRLDAEEIGCIRMSDAVIAHNSAMAGLLADRLSFPRDRIAELGIFDYLADGVVDQSRFMSSGPVAICGTLRRHKAGYAYVLPSAPEFNLYGVGYEGVPQENVSYKGSFPAGELSQVVEASFGLVWDGDEASTCSGVYGEYLRVNNPHKTSMYLSMGLPVVIWDKAALANLVVSNGVGIAISSLGDLVAAIEAVAPEDYARMKEEAVKFACRLRTGYFTSEAVGEAVGIAAGYAHEAAVL